MKEPPFGGLFHAEDNYEEDFSDSIVISSDSLFLFYNREGVFICIKGWNQSISQTCKTERGDSCRHGYDDSH